MNMLQDELCEIDTNAMFGPIARFALNENVSIRYLPSMPHDAACVTFAATQSGFVLDNLNFKELLLWA